MYRVEIKGQKTGDENMNNFETVAVAKAVAKRQIDAAKASLPVGSQPVDVTVRISGVINKFEDETYIPTAEIPLLATIALAVRKSGALRQHFLNCLFDGMTDAVEAGLEGKVDSILSSIDGQEVERLMQDVRSFARQLPSRIRQGKVTATLVTQETVAV